MTKSWYRHPWVSKIVIGLIVAIAAVTVIWLWKNVMWEAVKWLFTYSVSVPLAVLVLLGLLSLLFIIGAITRRCRKAESSPSEAPSIDPPPDNNSPSNVPLSKYSITEKEIDGVHWQYHLAPTRSGCFAWVDYPICPKCKNELDYGVLVLKDRCFWQELNCSHCPFKGATKGANPEDVKEYVRREIERRDRLKKTEEALPPPAGDKDEDYDPLKYGLYK